MYSVYGRRHYPRARIGFISRRVGLQGQHDTKLMKKYDEVLIWICLCLSFTGVLDSIKLFISTLWLSNSARTKISVIVSYRGTVVTALSSRNYIL